MKEAIKDGFEIAVFDDGLQAKTIYYDIKFVSQFEYPLIFHKFNTTMQHYYISVCDEVKCLQRLF